MNVLKENTSARLYFFSALEHGDGKVSDIEVLRVGIIQDRGLKITDQMLKDYVAHFDDNTYGTEIQVNLEHNRGSEAAGWIKGLYIKRDLDAKGHKQVRLIAKVEWTELGIEKVSKNLFKFVSVELAPKYPHHESGKTVSNVFIGLALTNTPAMKGQAPISLSEVNNNLTNKLMFKALLSEYKSRKFVSKADKALLTKLSEELPEEEKAEVAPEVAEVVAKPEEAPVEEPKAAETLAEEVTVEKFNELAASNQLLTEKLAKIELSEVADKLMVSDKKNTGFLGASKAEVINFMLGLSDVQRTAFVALMGSVKHVDLKEIGGKAGKEKEPDGDEGLDEEEKAEKYAEKLTAKAAKILKDGKAKDIEEAQKMAKKDLEEKTEEDEDEEMKGKK